MIESLTITIENKMHGLNVITIMWQKVTDAGEQIQKQSLVHGILNPTPTPRCFVTCPNSLVRAV
jgi:hypothetical protein